MGKFRVKIKRSWFSVKFAKIVYSTNGIFWKDVSEYHYDGLYNRCYMKTLYVNLLKDVGEVLKGFDTLEKVNNHTIEQQAKVDEHNAKISDENKIEREKIEDMYNNHG